LYGRLPDGEQVTDLPPRYDDATALLGSAGLDLITAFDGSSYNAIVSEHPSLKPLDTFGREHVLALLIGNTRALWPALKRAVNERPDLLTHDPVDRHVEDSVLAAVEQLSKTSRVHFGHHRGPDMVSMLHVAEASGLAHIGPAHLAVHSEHGLWFALRAVVVIDWPWEGDVTPAPNLCSDCSAPCAEALDKALEQQPATWTGPGMGADWRNWVKIRDVCPVGQDARYSDEQIRYHYALDLSTLRGG
jgi:methylmalonic aciduria homocystinuria type C protein